MNPLRAARPLAALTVALGCCAALPGASALAVETEADGCATLIRSVAVPAGWVAVCDDAHVLAEGVFGRVEPDVKRVTIATGMSLDDTSHAIGHELAHVEASRWSPAARDAAAVRMGAVRWDGDPNWATNAAERFAESESACQGWHRGEIAAAWGMSLLSCNEVDAITTEAAATITR